MQSTDSFRVSTGNRLLRPSGLLKALVLGTSLLIAGCQKSTVDSAKLALQATAQEPKDKPAAAAPEPERKILSFDELVAVLEQKFGKAAIREVKKLGPMTVVLFTDRHVDRVRKQNIERLSLLEKEWDVEIVGVENVVKAPDSTEHKRMAAYVNSVLEPKPTELLEETEGGGGRKIREESWGTYKNLFKDPRFVSVGIEDEKLFREVAPGAVAEGLIDSWMEVVIEGTQKREETGGKSGAYVIVSHGDEYAWHFLTYKKIQNHYKNVLKDEMFPELDFRKIKGSRKIVDGREFVLLSDEDGPLVGELAFRYVQWTEARAIYQRNEASTKILLDAMKERGFTRGAMLYGNRHTRPVKGGKTLQEHLAAADASYIVVDYER